LLDVAHGMGHALLEDVFEVGPRIDTIQGHRGNSGQNRSDASTVPGMNLINLLARCRFWALVSSSLGRFAQPTHHGMSK
jgi:hypothetical protein